MNVLQPSSDNKGFIKILSTLALFLKTSNRTWYDMDIKLIKLFIKKWLHKKMRTKKLTPHGVEGFIVNLNKVLDLKRGKTPIIVKSQIKTHVTRLSRTYFQQNWTGLFPPLIPLVGLKC